MHHVTHHVMHCGMHCGMHCVMHCVMHHGMHDGIHDGMHDGMHDVTRVLGAGAAVGTLDLGGQSPLGAAFDGLQAVAKYVEEALQALHIGGLCMRDLCIGDLCIAAGTLPTMFGRSLRYLR